MESPKKQHGQPCRTEPIRFSTLSMRDYIPFNRRDSKGNIDGRLPGQNSNARRSDPQKQKPKTLGEQLCAIRMHNFMTVKQDAQLLGVNESNVSKWELKGSQPSPDKMERIEAFFQAHGAENHLMPGNSPFYSTLSFFSPPLRLFEQLSKFLSLGIRSVRNISDFDLWIERF